LESQFAGYSVIPYRPEYRSQVLELQTLVWGPDIAKNSAYFDWKFQDNPYYVNGPIIYLALHGEHVVGMRGMFGTLWQGGQPTQVMRGLSDADGLVHPEHRRRGLLQAMTNMSLTDLSNSGAYEYDISLSANQFSAPSLLKGGWRAVGCLGWAHRQAPQADHSRLRKLARKLPVLPSVYRRLRDYVRGEIESSSSSHVSPFAALDRASIETIPDAATRIRVEKAPRPSAMAGLVERVGADGRIRQARDQQFFAWRFQNPLAEYRFLFWEGNRLEGYLVLQTPAPPRGGWVTLVDWEASNAQIWAELIRAAVQWGAFDMLTIWSAMLQEEAKSVLWQNGFRLSDEEESQAQAAYRPRLLVRPIAREEPDLDWIFAGRRLLDISNWDLRPIDSDAF